MLVAGNTFFSVPVLSCAGQYQGRTSLQCQTELFEKVKVSDCTPLNRHNILARHTYLRASCALLPIRFRPIGNRLMRLGLQTHFSKNGEDVASHRKSPDAPVHVEPKRSEGASCLHVGEPTVSSPRCLEETPTPRSHGFTRRGPRLFYLWRRSHLTLLVVCTTAVTFKASFSSNSEPLVQLATNSDVLFGFKIRTADTCRGTGAPTIVFSNTTPHLKCLLRKNLISSKTGSFYGSPRDFSLF